MAKKKTRLIPTSDYVTGYADHVWQTLVDCAEETKSVYPMLTYAVDGQEFSVPMSFRMFTEMGKSVVAKPAALPILIARMGTEFALLAMQMSSCGSEADFTHDVECVLRRIKPQCLVFSAPVRTVRSKKSSLTRGEIVRAMSDAVAKGPDAVVVVSRNPVRTFSVVRPMSRSLSGDIVFGEPETMDSLLGEPQPGGYFSRVFDPDQN
jgi:hypothetical protein